MAAFAGLGAGLWAFNDIAARLRTIMKVKDLRRKLEVVVMGCIRGGGWTTTCEIVRKLQRNFGLFGLRPSGFGFPASRAWWIRIIFHAVKPGGGQLAPNLPELR